MKIIREQLTQTRDELEAMCRAFYKQEYGIEEGVIVVNDEQLVKHRCGSDCRVEKVYVDLNAYYEPLGSKPKIRVAMETKNGWGKVRYDLKGNEWKLKD